MLCTATAANSIRRVLKARDLRFAAWNACESYSLSAKTLSKDDGVEIVSDRTYH